MIVGEEEKIEEAYAKALARELGKTRLSINFLELFTALFALGKADWFGITTKWTIPPYSVLVINDYAPPGEVAVPFAVKLSPSVDFALMYYLYIDDKLRYMDTSVYTATYSTYFNFLQVGALFAGRKETRKIVNTTSSSVDLIEFVTYARIPEQIWDRIIRKYFSTLSEEVGI
ncbi:hypothetical protein [Candidatus Methanodesulfokora washburnensis]|nr:hypothetical protein [Candidatus Methanodesulfokores washburnensis]